MDAEPLDEFDDTPVLGEMSTAQALHVLSAHHLGRLAFAHESWPVIEAVNYAFDEPSIVIRTAPGAKLTSTPFHSAAFEIDDADPGGAWGWSVLVQGPAFDITNSIDERSLHLRHLVLHPFAPGVRHHWLTISALHVRGRYFGHLPDGVFADATSAPARP